jgi:hypothetical protein
MTGNIVGAIEDFEFYLEKVNKLLLDKNTEPESKEEYKKDKAEREQWIKDLKAGKNPFTPELRKKLLDEE